VLDYCRAVEQETERVSKDDSRNAPGAAEAPDVTPPSGMKLVIELAPLVLFFLVYSRFDIYSATGVLMVATVASLVASKVLLGKLSVMPIVTGAFVLVFGALTLWFSNETFIKVKPTIVYLCFAVPLLGGLLFRKSLLSHVLGEAISLDESGWRTLTLRWGLFFIVLAILNEIVWRNFSTSVWVSMKSFGFIPLTILFAISQAPLMMRHKPQPQVDKKEHG
jgi:intracellular septation protein